MRMYDLIKCKRDGGVLDNAQIAQMIAAYTAGQIPDYQMSAFAMAVFFRGMTPPEISALTQAMADSGERIDLSEFSAMTCDKHSTGGVGDKTTLIVVPAAAALGAKMAQMTGRGLGHTGGTTDKLEVFDGYQSEVSPARYVELIRETGIAVVGQNDAFVPADKKLYALRDVTATVDSLALIASSIMSKKIAAGSHNLVLDVKTGSGAFMREYEDSLALARTMIRIGKDCGRNVRAVITDMDQPLGNAVGNSNEVVECIEILRGQRQGDVYEVSCVLAAQLLCQCFGWAEDEALARVRQVIASGAALEKFRQWIGSHGGDTRYIDAPERFAKPAVQRDLCAWRDGWIIGMNCERVGASAVALGAGRAQKGDSIDPAAGLYFLKKAGDAVQKGETIVCLGAADTAKLDEAEKMLRAAIFIGDKKPAPRPLIHCILKDDV